MLREPLIDGTSEASGRERLRERFRVGFEEELAQSLGESRVLRANEEEVLSFATAATDD